MELLIDSAKIQRIQEFEKKSFYQFEEKLNKTQEDYFYNQVTAFSDNEFGFFSTYKKIFKHIFSNKEELETYYAGLFKKYFKSTDQQRTLVNEIQAFQTSLHSQRLALLKETKIKTPNYKPKLEPIDLAPISIQSTAPIQRAEKELFIELISLAIELTPLIISSVLIFLGFASFKVSSRLSILLTILGLIFGIYFGITANNKMETQLINNYKQYLEKNKITIVNQLLNQQKEYYENITQK